MKKNIFQHVVRSFSAAVLQRSGLAASAISLLLCSSTPLLLNSCKNRETVKEDTFMITPKIIRNHMATFEVAPINNEFFYYADAITVSDYNKYGERAIADSVMRYYDRVKATLDELDVPYDDETLYYRGLYNCITTELPPETPCYFFCMRLKNKDKSPILPLVLYPFTTTKKVWHDDFTVDVHVEGDTVYYTPNNDTYTYLYDFISIDELRRDYAGWIDYYASTMISTYEEYGFIDQVLQKGPATLTISDWYDDLQSGDTIVTCYVGYETSDFTTEIIADTITLP